MHKRTGRWLIAGAALVLLGAMIFGGLMMTLGWDFSKLSTVKYETNTHEVMDRFQSITVDTDTADITFLPAEDGRIQVVCHEPQNAKHALTVADGVLTIRQINEKKWYDYIGFDLGSTKITVYLPKGDYQDLRIRESTGDITIPEDFRFESMDIRLSTGNVTSRASVLGEMKIKTSTGDITVSNIAVEAMDLTVSTGKVHLSKVSCDGDVKIRVSTGKTEITDLSCQSLFSQGNTGDITLKNVIATEKFSIERTTGNVRFDRCDAAELWIQTDTGNVGGTLLSEKVFRCKTDTGRVEVPQTITGGKCEIITDTGDIHLQIIS